MTITALFDKYLPKSDGETREHIVWEHTGYPCFWGQRSDESSEECFERQIKEFAEKYPDGDCKNSCVEEMDAAHEEWKLNHPEIVATWR